MYSFLSFVVSPGGSFEGKKSLPKVGELSGAADWAVKKSMGCAEQPVITSI